MPVINITTWPTDKEKKTELLGEVTKVIHRVTGAPLDKISVFIQEVEPCDWADAGIVGTDPDFKEKSRRLEYAEGE